MYLPGTTAEQARRLPPLLAAMGLCGEVWADFGRCPGDGPADAAASMYRALRHRLQDLADDKEGAPRLDLTDWWVAAGIA